MTGIKKARNFSLFDFGGARNTAPFAAVELNWERDSLSGNTGLRQNNDDRSANFSSGALFQWQVTTYEGVFMPDQDHNDHVEDRQQDQPDTLGIREPIELIHHEQSEHDQ